jgi:peptidoglycan pentaglycine glycine transferase (the first glycine)
VSSGPTWDRALAELASPAPLLQSWGYGEVQREEGWRAERVGLPSGACAAVLLRGGGGLGRGYVPRGPVPASVEAVRELLEWAGGRGIARLRVEPEAPPAFGRELQLLGFRPSRGMHPERTLVVPLGDEESMMASFKPKHRYNVRLALRRGIEVEEGADASELHRQHLATAHRQGISAPSLRSYQLRLDRLAWCRTYVARHQGRPLAAIMVARFAGRGYYLFGGSSGERRELMPTYAVQWAAMRAASTAGCRDYDLWGLPPGNDPDHPWHGLWQFKTGFGGIQVEFCGAWEAEVAPVRARLGVALERLAAARRLVRRAR